MIADSSSRLPRDTTDNNSPTTALRDRGPCLIPQPNRCLPIRPAPPTPILKARKDQLPILKLAKVSHADSVDPDTANITKSTNLKVDSLKEVEAEKQLDSFKQDGSTDENRSVSCDSCTLYAIKRNMSEECDKEHIKEVVKEGRKRKKSAESEVEVTAVVSREFCKNCGDNLVDKANKSDEKRVADLWNSIRSVAADVSTTENHFFKDNKVVPPLRLKKVVQEKNDGCGNSAETFNAEEEINYRIVTHSSVHPDSIFSSVFCSNCNSNSEVMEKDRNLNVTSSTSREIQSRRFLIKSDEYKLKHRRNRLKQKLKELKNKALNLAQEMSSSLSTEECNLQRNTRLRQMMNRYEKQIQNISKLLDRLSDSDSVSENLVIEIDGEEKKEEQRDDDSTCSFSSTFSSEPPKLSPRSPMDSRRSIESPDQISNSPPVLPRVSITVTSDLNIQEEQNKEEIDENRKNLQLLTESTWITCNDSLASFCANVADRSWYSNDLINIKMNGISTPSVSSSTSVNPCSLDDVQNTENAKVFLNNMGQNVEDNSVEIIPEGKESVEELSKHIEVVPSDDQTPLILDDMIKIQKHELNDSDVNGTQTQTVEDVEAKPIEENTKFSCKLQQEDIFVSSPSLTNGGSALLNTNVLHLQSNYGGATVSYRNMLDSDKMKKSRSTLTSNTVSSSNRFTDVSYMPITSAAVQERPFSVSNHQFNASNKDDDLKNNCEFRNSDKHNTMADQFLTFGNWVANMAKKQTLQQKPKAQNIIPTEQTHCVIESNNQRVLTNNSVFDTPRNNNVNATSQWNCESWQHQHQQQVLQQATAFSQTSPTLTTSHSGIHHPPLSASQFYSNNYPIDPYGGTAFSYYSTLYPTYGSYPYSRLRPGSPFTGFHVPVQDPLTAPLRPLQQFNKHVTSLTDSNRHCTSDILKCSGAISNTGFQLPNTAINFDRFRVTSGNHNTETNCLSPLLLPPAPSAVVSRQQTLPRMPVNTDYGRNRTIPDVVAAAAAAAVVAAASIGHQNDSVPAYERTGVPTDTATLEVDSTRSSDQQLHHSQLQNLLLDGVQFHPIRVDSNTADFTQASGLASNAQTSTFKIPLIVESLPQGSKENSRNITRNCETPHLAKISRGSNSLSSLNCSNCGAAGSMFKCLGCEVAFYCDERCQARHWSIHVEKCPKRMPKLKKVA